MNNYVTVSSKYQVVIPKAARKQLGLKPGQKIGVGKVVGNKITLTVPLSDNDYIAHYAGSVPSGTWGSDPVKTIRKLRQELDV